MSSMHKFGPIHYLIGQKFPLYGQLSRLRFGDSSGLDLDERNRRLDEIEDYERELRALAPRELQARVGVEKKKEAAAEEALRPFNLPEASADYGHYVTFGWWSAVEAIALLLGRDPRKVTWSIVEPHVGVSPFAEDFRRLRERVVRSPLANQSDRVTPQQWIEWALSQALPIPGALVDAAKAFGLAAAHYQELKRRSADLETELAAERDAVRRSEEKIDATLASERPLGMQERDTLLSIIITMAIAFCDFQPGKRSNFIARITHEMELLRLNRSDDTVRKHMQAAEELLPANWSEKWTSRRRA